MHQTWARGQHTFARKQFFFCFCPSSGVFRLFKIKKKISEFIVSLRKLASNHRFHSRCSSLLIASILGLHPAPASSGPCGGIPAPSHPRPCGSLSTLGPSPSISQSYGHPEHWRGTRRLAHAGRAEAPAHTWGDQPFTRLCSGSAKDGTPKRTWAPSPSPAGRPNRPRARQRGVPVGPNHRVAAGSQGPGGAGSSCGIHNVRANLGT